MISPRCRAMCAAVRPYGYSRTLVSTTSTPGNWLGMLLDVAPRPPRRRSRRPAWAGTGSTSALRAAPERSPIGIVEHLASRSSTSSARPLAIHLVRRDPDLQARAGSARARRDPRHRRRGSVRGGRRCGRTGRCCSVRSSTNRVVASTCRNHRRVGQRGEHQHDEQREQTQARVEAFSIRSAPSGRLHLLT